MFGLQVKFRPYNRQGALGLAELRRQQDLAVAVGHPLGRSRKRRAEALGGSPGRYQLVSMLEA